MRKGQLEIIETAKRWGYSDIFIELLSQEGTTIKQLKTMLHRLYPFADKDKDREWAQMFQSVENGDLHCIIQNYRRKYGDVDNNVLEHLTTVDKACAYFSGNGVLCEDLTDVMVVMQCSEYLSYMPDIFALSRAIRRSTSCDEYRLSSAIDDIIDSMGKLADPRPFMAKLEPECFCDNYIANREYVSNCYRRCFEELTFSMSAADDIPEDVKLIDLNGYSGRVDVSGFCREVLNNNGFVTMTMIPYDHVDIGKSHVSPDLNRHRARRILFTREQDFVYGYNTKSGFKYVPARLRDLFDIISIGNTEKNKNDAWSVVNFLCRKYDTYLFKDLYNDYLESGGLLLPALITDIAQYKTKSDMLRGLYKIEMNSNWNAKNVNVSYMIIKLYSRMTNAAISRAMQCKTVISVVQAGRDRCILLEMLYGAVYGINELSNSLLRDALRDEYNDKCIYLDPVNITVNRHNARYRDNVYSTKAKPFKIKKDTVFKKLIKHMPKEYELIKTSKRLSEEGKQQHNCVAGYADRIKKDECMIYSTVYEGKRYTIEINVTKDRRYRLAQCRSTCNQSSRNDLPGRIKALLDDINNMR